MSKRYERWLDDAAEPDANFNLEVWQETHIESLLNIARMAYYASLIPRRLGENATPPELAFDKKFSRKLKSIILGLISGQWQLAEVREEFQDTLANPLDPDDEQDLELRASAATVDWQEWLTGFQEITRLSLRYVAANLHGVDPKAANRLCHRLEQEIAQVSDLYTRLQNS